MCFFSKERKKERIKGDIIIRIMFLFLYKERGVLNIYCVDIFIVICVLLLFIVIIKYD